MSSPKLAILLGIAKFAKLCLSLNIVPSSYVLEYLIFTPKGIFQVDMTDIKYNCLPAFDISHLRKVTFKLSSDIS